MSVRIEHGDCLTVMSGMAADSFDACVTDPPYHLTSIVKRFGGENAAPAKHGTDGAFARASRGFMGKQWDGGDIAFRSDAWAEVLRVMKPGAFMVAFASTRGYHRMVCAIEDAGFIIHPMLGWLFGTGFPKATKFKCAEAEGWRYGLQALKPALEPICMAQKPMIGTGTENWLAHGCGGLNIDASRVGTEGATKRSHQADYARNADGSEDRSQHWARTGHAIETLPLGRWPANVIHDGSDEVLEAFAAFGESKSSATLHAGSHKRSQFGQIVSSARTTGFSDTGTAARFFYSAKASKADRQGTTHPTTKPIALMQYLCRLITPPGGTVLDPFGGSGTTAVACLREGFNAVLIEREAEYVAMIQSRVKQERGAQADMFAA